MTWAPLATSGEILVRTVVTATEEDARISVARACRRRVFDFGARYFLAAPLEGEGYPVISVPHYIDPQGVERATLVLGDELNVNPVHFIPSKKARSRRTDLAEVRRGRVFRGEGHGGMMRMGGRQVPFGDLILKVTQGSIHGIVRRAARLTPEAWASDALDDAAWKRLGEAGSPDAYLRYIEEFPGGRHVTSAKLKAGDLTAGARPKRREPAPPTRRISSSARGASGPGGRARRSGNWMGRRAGKRRA